MPNPRKNRAQWERSIFVGVVAGLLIGALVGHLTLGALLGLALGWVVDLDKLVKRIIDRWK